MKPVPPPAPENKASLKCFFSISVQAATFLTAAMWVYLFFCFAFCASCCTGSLDKVLNRPVNNKY